MNFDRSYSKHSKLLLYLSVLAAFAGFFIRLWIAKQWVYNFDSDEALFGIMSRRLLQGEYLPTVYGTEHLGSFESVLGAFFFFVFGEGVLQLRMSVLVLMLIFFLVNIIIVRKSWGAKPALLSTLFLILPGFHILTSTHQTIWASGALLALGATYLAVEQLSPDSVRAKVSKYVVLGLFAGLGLWSNQMFMVYLVSPFISRFISSKEWAANYRRIRKWVELKRKISIKLVTAVYICCLFLLFVLAFFISGCSPRELFIRLSIVAKLGLFAALLFGLAVFMYGNPLRKSHIATISSFIAGLAIGYSPQWGVWVRTGIKTAPVLYPSCPRDLGSRTILTLREILPAMWGVPSITDLIERPIIELLAWILIIILIFVALFWVINHYKNSLISLLNLSPLSLTLRPIVTVFLLFALPIILSLLGGNTVDVYSVRHLLVSWHASSILFAVFLAKVRVRRTYLIGLAAAVWIGFVGAYNLTNAPRWWNVKFTTYHPDDIQELETYLFHEGDTYGYADYWGAFTLDFLSQERLTIAPYNGINRIPSYSKAVRNTTPITFIFPLEHAPTQDSQAGLCDYLSREHVYSGEGPAKEGILERCRTAGEVSRTEVAAWEVWILND